MRISVTEKMNSNIWMKSTIQIIRQAKIQERWKNRTSRRCVSVNGIQLLRRGTILREFKDLIGSTAPIRRDHVAKRFAKNPKLAHLSRLDADKLSFKVRTE